MRSFAAVTAVDDVTSYYSLELSLWAAQKGGGQELQNMPNGIIAGKRQRISPNEFDKKSERKEGDHICAGDNGVFEAGQRKKQNETTVAIFEETYIRD